MFFRFHAWSLLCACVAFFACGVVPTDLLAQAQPAAAQVKPNEAPLRQFNAAAAMHNKKIYDLAADEWAKFVEKYPTDERAPSARFFLGVCYRQTKDWDKAAAAFEQLIATAPKFDKLEDTYLYLGMTYFTQGREGKAEQYPLAIKTFGTLLEKYPQSKYAGEAYFYQGESQYASGNKAEAIKSYGKLVAMGKAHDLLDDAMYALGVAQEEQNLSADAAKTYTSYVAKYPQSKLLSEVRFRLGELAYNDKNLAVAIPNFAAAVQDKDFKLADFAQLRLADSYYQQKQYPQAAEAFATLLAKYPASQYQERARLSLGRCQYLLTKYAQTRETLKPLLDPPVAGTPEAAHWTIRSWLKENQPAQALTLADTALKLPQTNGHPFAVQLQLDRADALYETPATRPDALKQYVDLFDHHPKDVVAAEALYMGAFTALGLGQAEAALKLSQQFAKTFPGSSYEPDVLSIAAESQLQLKQYAAAEASFAALRTKFPQHTLAAKAPLREGIAQYFQKKYAETVATEALVLKAKPTPEVAAEAHYWSARALQDSQKLDLAAAELAATLAAQPQGKFADQALLLLGHVQSLRKDPKAAAAAWQDLITKFPNSPHLAESYYRLAESKYAANDFAGSTKLYETLLKSYPDSPLVAHARHGLGWAQLSQGQFAPAAQAFTDLLAGKPEPELANRALYARALAYRQLKDFAKSSADLLAFLKTNPPPREASEARYELGLCQVGLGQLEAAATTFQQLLKSDPTFANTDKVLYELGWAQKSQQKEADAAVAFRTLTEKFAESPLAGEANFHVAEQLYNEKKFADAVPFYKQCVAKSGMTDLAEKASHKLGWTLYRAEDYPASAAQFAAQTTAFPQGSLAIDARFMQGENLFKLGKFAEASDAYQKALSGYGAQAEKANPAFMQLALLHAAQSATQQKPANWEQGLKYADELLAKFDESPYRPEAVYERGWALQHMNRMDDALKAYGEVPDLTDGEVAAKSQFMRGEIYFQLQNHKEAIRCFFKAAYSYSYPEWAANGLFEAGRCFEVLKRSEEARKVYKELIDTYKDSDKVPLAQQRLQQLGAK